LESAEVAKGKRKTDKRTKRDRARRSERRGAGIPRDVLLAVLLIVALAVVVRVAYMVEVHDHPLMTTTTGDPKVYDTRALEIAGGQWLDDEVFFHSSPVYPYILGVIYKLFGHSYAAVRVVQSLFGIGSCLLIFSLARKLFDKREGLIAGVVAALYAPFVFFDFEILMITYVIFFALLALRLLLAYVDEPKLWLVLASGASIGVSSLGKPNLLLFVPFALVWLWWATKGTEAGKRAGSAIGLLLVGVIAVVAPMTISNYAIAGDFVLTSSNGGINFWIGNNEQADGTFLVPADMRADLYAGSKLAAEQALGHELKPSEVSSYWFDEGLAFLRENPGRGLKLLGKKLLLFWNAYEIPNHYDLNYFRTVSKTMRFDPFVFAWVIPVGFLGMYVSRREWKRLLLLYLFGGAYLLSLMPFFVTSRYRLPVVPVMIVFSATGLSWLWKRLRERERTGWMIPVVILVATLIVVNLPIIDFSLGPQYAIIGSIYRDAGDYESAVEYYRLAVEESPEFDLAYNSLGSSLSRVGRDVEAERAFLKALEINPRLASAKSNLGLLYLQRGRVDEARRRLLAATEDDPTLKAAWDNLARLGIVTQDAALATYALERTITLDPRDAYAHWNLAILYGADPERLDDCIRHAREAAALDPSLRREAAEMIGAVTGEVASP
jgi:4-amino-4-deoxy-L-arabinose transferase-like glycosyltransferase/Flp pilus assembly protein TadD